MSIKEKFHPTGDRSKKGEKIPYKPLVLIILDGFGVNTKIIESPWKLAKHPVFEEIEKFYPFTTLQASGIAVGLPWKEEGNSEVGHFTIGAGKIVYTHLPRIGTAIQDGSFFENEALKEAANKVKNNNCAMHFAGLFSTGSVHASSGHLYALLDFAKSQNIFSVFLHLFMDGRDAPPYEGKKIVSELEERLAKDYPFAKIASVIGRDFAMDRDGHWDKIERAYRLLTEGAGEKFGQASLYLKKYHEERISDEFIPAGAFRNEEGNDPGLIKNGDAVVFFNFREDSMREIVSAFTKDSFSNFSRPYLSDLLTVTMTEYEKGVNALVAFPPIDVEWPLSRIISERGLTQLHIAETEKYAHVTYFFNGGRENLLNGEERMLIASPRTAHFDETPEMSAHKVTDTVTQNLAKYDFILVNFANADMVGHTGDIQATVKALEVLDFSVGKIIPKILDLGGLVVITGDHGNAEEKLYGFSGEKKTKHSLNPVPFYIIAKEFKSTVPKTEDEIKKNYEQIKGSLMDVAPTILELFNLPKPQEMTGISLLEKLM